MSGHPNYVTWRGIHASQGPGHSPGRQCGHAHRGQVAHSRPHRREDPYQQCPSGDDHRRHLVGMTGRQRGRALSVEGLARKPFSESEPMVVGHMRHRLIPKPRARLDQPPAQVHVLTALQRFVESAYLVDRGPPDHNRRTRDVRHRTVRHHRSLPQAEIQRGTYRLVPGNSVVTQHQSHDARRDQGHRRITEVPQQRLEPTAPWHHIRIEERNEVRRRELQTGVASRRRTLTVGVAHHLHVTMHAF
ncbi:Uncharacterised protein [Mycobacteroides abscessus subsp. abscessus]|nr:Uncharacterised protein [Mycobacteroides abscessus subsp. abscessus]